MATMFRISAGPGKFDLMLSLFEGKKITFTVEELGKLEADAVHDIGVDHECNEGWTVKGFLKKFKHDDRARRFEAFLDSARRIGNIKIDGIVHHCTECGEEQEFFSCCKHCHPWCNGCFGEVPKDAQCCPHCGNDLV